MKRLFHWSFDPRARLVRLVLAEKDERADLVESLPWAPDPEIARLAPGAAAPALIDNAADGRVVAIGARAICAHLEESIREPRLLPHGRQDRAEAHRIWDWSDEKLGEVDRSLLAERVAQWARRLEPDSAAMRKGAHALRSHLTFLNALAEQRPYLAGRSVSLADLSCAARLSAYDYFADVDWPSVPDLKAWYAKIKSRPSFRTLLEDRMEGTRPAAHYANLDF